MHNAGKNWNFWSDWDDFCSTRLWTGNAEMPKPRPGTRAHANIVEMENRLSDCERGAIEAEAGAKQALDEHNAKMLLECAKDFRAEAADLRRSLTNLTKDDDEKD